MEFKLSEEQIKKYEKWRKKLPKKYFGTIGGGTKFTFEPTGLGSIVTVTFANKYTLDLTEEDKW